MIIGKKLIRLRTVDSTNDEVRRQLALGAGEGLVVLAEEQTKGKGRPGKKWFSPRGNLFLSAAVKPYKNPKELAPITLLGALAARQAVESKYKITVTIKWPNDLLIKGKKVGGVLVERLASGFLIIGIGLNLNTLAADFPPELKATATSLLVISGKKSRPETMANLVIKALDQEYLEYLRKIC